MEKLLKIDQVAESLQVSRSLIYKWVHYGYMPHVKIGTLLRFKESELEKWLRVKVTRGRVRKRIDINS